MGAMLTLGAGLTLACAPALGQDSVATSPGGNDALLPWEPIAQRVRYIVDLVDADTSWGGQIAVGPVLKASRSLDPNFRTQVLGAGALSADSLGGATFASTGYLFWTSAGAGINFNANSAPGQVSITSVDERFALAMNGLADDPTEIIGATIGRDTNDLSRLYVERVMALSSRGSPVSADSSTVSLGGVDAAGGVHIRADRFNGGTILGQNILRVDLDDRSGSVNALSPMGAANVALDAAATSFLINAGGPTASAPAGMLQSAPSEARHSLALDFAEMYISGSDSAEAFTSGSHVVAALEPRGNPTYSISTVLGGDGGTVGLLARSTPADGADTLAAFGLELQSDLSGPRVAPASRRSAPLPNPVTGPGGFVANASPGDALFTQYLNQTPFRGGSGHVGVGQNAQGELILAATATDVAVGDFIAVARFTGQDASWSVAARVGQSVLDGPGGNSIGALIDDAPTSMSAPAVDLLGNVYFTARWLPSSGPGMGAAQTGLFRAVNGGAAGYQLERLLTTGAMFTGANSASFYFVSGLALADSDSVASGATHGGAILQRQVRGRETASPASVFAFGGLVVHATIDYLRPGGLLERYEAQLFIGPRGSAAACPGDVSGDNFIDFADLNIVLGEFNQSGQGLQGDVDGDDDVDFADLNVVVSGFNTAC